MKPNELFPAALKLINMSYALQILGYIKRRQDTLMGEHGNQIYDFMQKFRAVPEENKGRYYDILAPIITALFKYAQIEEQASKSGHYEGNRLQCLNSLRAAFNELEGQPDVLEYLNGLLTTKVVEETPFS